MIGTFTDAMQKRILEQYRQKYPPTHPTGEPPLGYEKYAAPQPDTRQLRSLQKLL